MRYRTESQNIDYKVMNTCSVDDYIKVLKSSGLSERRPVQYGDIIEGMVLNSNLFITASLENNMIGLLRAVTDYNFCCYISDLAVDKAYQKKGIGKKMLKIAKENLNEQCEIILIAAPSARSYYEHIGYIKNDSCYTIL